MRVPLVAQLEAIVISTNPWQDSKKLVDLRPNKEWKVILSSNPLGEEISSSVVNLKITHKWRSKLLFLSLL